MEPGDSGGVGPVEVAIERPAATFLHGACAGIALAAVAAQCWLAVTLAPLRDAYKDMSADAAHFPLVLHPAWLWGAPVAGVLALAVLVSRRPRGLAPYACLALVLVGAAIATWHYAYAPLNELAGNIQG